MITYRICGKDYEVSLVSGFEFVQSHRQEHACYATANTRRNRSLFTKKREILSLGIIRKEKSVKRWYKEIKRTCSGASVKRHNILRCLSMESRMIFITCPEVSMISPQSCLVYTYHADMGLASDS